MQTAETSKRRAHERLQKWVIGFAVVAVVSAGLFWYGLGRASGSSPMETVSATVADCVHGGTQAMTTLVVSERPIVVGLGSVGSMAAFNSSRGVMWCYDQMGSSTGFISTANLRESVYVAAANFDGATNSAVLMLVHHDSRTVAVVVYTKWSTSMVKATGGGFEVLRLSTDRWPKWHVPWRHSPVALGRIVGYDRTGVVTASQTFSWCPGTINSYPDAGGC